MSCQRTIMWHCPDVALRCPFFCEMLHSVDVNRVRFQKSQQAVSDEATFSSLNGARYLQYPVRPSVYREYRASLKSLPMLYDVYEWSDRHVRLLPLTSSRDIVRTGAVFVRLIFGPCG